MDDVNEASVIVTAGFPSVGEEPPCQGAPVEVISSARAKFEKLVNPRKTLPLLVQFEIKTQENGPG